MVRSEISRFLSNRSFALLTLCFNCIHTFLFEALPDIVSKNASYFLNQSASVTLNCEIAGGPRPVLAWYKNDKLIYKYDPAFDTLEPQPLGETKLEFYRQNGSLRIVKLSMDDTGLYTCRVGSSSRFPTASLNYTIKGNSFPSMLLAQK